MSDVQYRETVIGDEDQIIELLIEAFDEWRGRKENARNFYEWLYKETPLRENLILVACIQNKIIGAYHDLVLKIKLGDEITKWVYCTDVVVHPDYRGLGIYSKFRVIEYEINENRDITGNYHYTTNPIIIRSDGKAIGPIPANVHFPNKTIRYIRIKNIDLHLAMKKAEQKRIKKIGYSLLKSESNIKKHRSRLDDSEIQVKETKQITAEYDELWRKVSKKINFGLVRDAEYLKWRYFDPRAHTDYHFFEARKESHLKGFLVFKITNYNEYYQTGHIVDYLFDETPQVPELLITKIVDIADEKKINSVDCLAVEGSKFANALEKNEFIDNKEKIVLRYNTMKNNDRDKIIQKSRPNQLHITHADLFLI